MESLAARVEGRIINGKYQVLRFLGEGGMGLVFEGVVVETGEGCALKFMRPEVAVNPEVLQRFIREARTVAALRHPNIVGIFGEGELEKFEELSFIAMELLKGMGLDEQVKKGPLPWSEAIAIVRQATVPLEFAHQRGIIHRDLKPENLFVNALGTLKVMDFGIAKVLDATRMTMPKMVFGSLAYMSREQARGDADLDLRSDIYSLGVVLYQLISGKLPYGPAIGDMLPFLARIAFQKPTDISAHVPNLPAPVLAVLRRALEPEREARFQSMEAFADALSSCLTVEKRTPENPTLSIHAGATQRLVAEAVPVVVATQRLAADAVPVEISREDSSRRVALNKEAAEGPGSLASSPRSSGSSSTMVFVVGLAAALSAGVGGWFAFRPAPPTAAPGYPKPAPPVLTAAPDLTSSGVATARLPDLAVTPSVAAETAPVPVSKPAPRVVDETAAGSLSVRSYPSGTAVRIDGRAVGHTPLLGFTLRPGKHSVELVADDGRREIRSVLLAPGRSENLKVKFP